VSDYLTAVYAMLLVHGTEKLCSKFGEDRFINHVTVLSADAGQRTHLRDYIFCPMQKD